MKTRETNKALFVLAQILITLAGFFIATSGFSFAMRMGLLTSTVSLIPNDDYSYTADVCGKDPIENFFIKSPLFFFWIGISLALISLIVWGCGFYRIRKYL